MSTHVWQTDCDGGCVTERSGHAVVARTSMRATTVVKNKEILEGLLWHVDLICEINTRCSG